MQISPSARFVGPLVLTALALTAADHWTTYVCLREPVSGWNVREANPLAEWLFARAGLVPGLLIDSVVTVGALGLLLVTRRFGLAVKLSFLSLMVLSTGFAVVNNLHAISQLGISPLGVG